MKIFERDGITNQEGRVNKFLALMNTADIDDDLDDGLLQRTSMILEAEANDELRNGNNQVTDIEMQPLNNDE